jgi:hypothetical protein
VKLLLFTVSEPRDLLKLVRRALHAFREHVAVIFNYVFFFFFKCGDFLMHFADYVLDGEHVLLCLTHQIKRDKREHFFA